MRPLAGVAVLALGGALVIASLMLWPFWLPGFFGLLLVASALVERRYRGAPRPATGWEPTPETFIDDETGRQMQVWYNPATGQRDYRAL